MWTLRVCLFTVCLLGQANASPKVSLEDLLERLESLEEWKRETEPEVLALRDLVTKQDLVIKNLERKLAVQTHLNITGTLKSCSQHENQDVHEHQFNEDETNEDQGQEPENRIRATGLDNKNTNQISRVDRAISGGVAFTAYLDHPINLGYKQTIKFNQIITNDANAYSIHTGVFTCPEAGVYMFTFVIGERDVTGFWAELVVNSHFVVGVSVDTTHPYQDLQGANTAIVRLNQGDVVWVDSLTSGGHVEGNASRRFTTFSGVYLYA